MNVKRSCSLLLVIAFISKAAPGNTRIEELQLTAGIRAERSAVYALAPEHELRLVRSLRRITGCAGLEFEPDGSLSLDAAPEVSCGSGEARRLLMRALYSGRDFIIEDYSGSSSVVFGQAEREQIYAVQKKKRT